MAELPLDPQKTALVLIDLQNAVLGMTPAPHSADKVVENSVRLANAFRAEGAPVVYVRVDLNAFIKVAGDRLPRGGRPSCLRASLFKRFHDPPRRPPAHPGRKAAARRSVGDRSF